MLHKAVINRLRVAVLSYQGDVVGKILATYSKTNVNTVQVELTIDAGQLAVDKPLSYSANYGRLTTAIEVALFNKFGQKSRTPIAKRTAGSYDWVHIHQYFEAFGYELTYIV